MATLEEFKAMRDAVPMSLQGELYSLLISEPAVTLQANGKIAAENDKLPAVEEVHGFLRLMDKRRFCISLNHLFSENQNWQHCLSIKCLRCGIDICFKLGAGVKRELNFIMT